MTIDPAPPFVMIDGFNMGLPRGTGVATYGRNLCRSAQALGYEVGVLFGTPLTKDLPPALLQAQFFDLPPAPEGRRQRWVRALRAVLAGSHAQAFPIHLTDVVVAQGVKDRVPPSDSLWNARDLYFRAAVRFEGARQATQVQVPRRTDLFHWTYPLPLRGRNAPNIYTLHDLVPLRLPYTTLDRKPFYHRLMQWVARTADHVVTVSEASRKDILELLPIEPDRVTNTYQAVTLPEDVRLTTEADLRERLPRVYGVPYGGYFLYFGAIEPKKNVGRMIEAYLGSGASVPLLIVGGSGWSKDEELRVLRERDRLLAETAGRAGASNVVLIDYLPTSALTDLVRGARALAFPSLYEGFGLPVLEAMLLGTPVLTSNTSSLPEITGDAALLVDPYDVRAMSAAFRALDEAPTLRADLSARGKVQAARFGEEAYRQRLGEVYRAVRERSRSATGGRRA